MIAREALVTPSIQKEIQRHACEAYPEESIGVVSQGKYVRLKNEHDNPETDALPEKEKFQNMLADEAVDCMVHSHPDGPFYPTYADMRTQIELDLPCGLVKCTQGTACTPVTIWGDSLKPTPLIGRPFQHGVTDCYEACRDWYIENMGIRLIQVPRSWEWWDNAENLYEDHIKRAGFFEVEDNKCQYGDAILFKIPTRGEDGRLSSTVYNHAAIYLGNDTIYHHTTASSGFAPDNMSGLTSLHNRLKGGPMFLRPDKENKVFS